jgi:hypothetical protein
MNGPLAGQAKSYEIVSDTRIANSFRDDTNLHFNGPVNVMDEDFPNLDALKVNNYFMSSQLPGRLFSPCDICKKLSHHFLLHFSIGMGSLFS